MKKEFQSSIRNRAIIYLVFLGVFGSLTFDGSSLRWMLTFPLGSIIGLILLYRESWKVTLTEDSIILVRFYRQKSINYQDITSWQTDRNRNIRLLTDNDELLVNRSIQNAPGFMEILYEQVPELKPEPIVLPWCLVDNGRFASWNDGLTKLVFQPNTIIAQTSTETTWPVDELVDIFKEAQLGRNRPRDAVQVVLQFKDDKKFVIKQEKVCAFGYSPDQIVATLHHLYPHCAPEKRLTKPERAQKLIEKGDQLRREMKSYEAIVAYKQAIAINPDRMIYNVKIGDLLFELGKYAEAQQVYQQGLEYDFDNLQAWMAYGRCAMKTRQFEEAAQAFGHALTLDPNNEELLLNAAMALSKLEKHALAQEHLQNLLNHALDWLPRIQQNPLLQHYLDSIELPESDAKSWLQKVFRGSRM